MNANLTANEQKIVAAFHEFQYVQDDEFRANDSGAWGFSISMDIQGVLGVSKRSANGYIMNLIKKGILHAVPQDDKENGDWIVITTAGYEAWKALQPVTMDDVADAVEKSQQEPVKPLTRKQCLEALKLVGYTGPTSYLMPKLRTIVDEQLAAAADKATVETATSR